MRRTYRRNRYQVLPPKILYRVNHQIRVPEVRLIDENGAPAGVVPLSEALARAQTAELDLVEVSPKAVPPVAKILDYGQFKYQKEKELKAQKVKQKTGEIKGIRLSLRIGQHDFDIRLEQAKRFLSEDNKVKIEIILRGRERQYTGQAKENMESFATALGNNVKVEQPFAAQGGKLSMVIAPVK